MKIKKNGPNINAKSKKLEMKWVRTPEVIWKDLSKEFNFTVDHPMYDIYIPKFVKKAINSKCLTVFLLPSSTNARYFHDYLYKKDNVEVRFLKRHHTGTGHKFFSEDNEEPKCGYLRPLMVVVIDNRAMK